MQVQERHARLSVHKLLGVVLALAAAGGMTTAVAAAAPPAGDALFVGDSVTSSIFRFPVAGTGLAAPTVFVSGGPAASADPNALNGPRGLVFVGGSLWVANQNAGRKFTGGINQYGADGAFAAALVSAVPSPGTNPGHAPFAPRGIVLWRDRLIVADLQGTGQKEAHDPLPTGDVEEYARSTGAFIDVLPRPAGVSFHPRGVVVGPDDALYVSNALTLATSGIGGQVLRYPDPGAQPETVIDCTPDQAASCRLNRPEGLVFGPDGTLYVTSFNNPVDPAHTNDKILEYRSFELAGQIDLDPVGAPNRTFAQALLFGPGGGLYVPITSTGEIRRYDVSHPTTPRTVAPPSAQRPFYLTFRQTDPGTLAYHG